MNEPMIQSHSITQEELGEMIDNLDEVVLFLFGPFPEKNEVGQEAPAGDVD